DGSDLCCLSRRRLQRLREHFGFVFQSGALFDSMSVYDNVAFPLREENNGLSESEVREKVMHELEQVGLAGSEDKLPAHLSGGMVKRAALARGLVVEPEIMFFDEPATGLDPMIGHTILELIRDCHERHNFTGVIVTHQLLDVFAIVHEVAMLRDGRIYFQGSPEEIKASEDPAIRDFINGNVKGISRK
ncbi:MAG: ATP-binding cassette domain-containing protein, partial [Lentisphaeria bacterium]